MLSSTTIDEGEVVLHVMPWLARQDSMSIVFRNGQVEVKSW